MDENIFNKVGSLTVLRNKLNKYGIYRFETFNEIIEFKHNYNDEINECIRLKTVELNREIEEYKQELIDHKNEYHDLIDEILSIVVDEKKHNLRFFITPPSPAARRQQTASVPKQV